VLSVGVGTGRFSKTVGDVNLGHLRGARLVTPTGTPLGIATFAALRLVTMYFLARPVYRRGHADGHRRG
jgi:hypothetical protein